mmetsp:Transcript_5584/g.12828  ORF Transcript_5584/g.12828 Transcript_5584/m.12828 type:complete len:232 (+) Transcript_5584:121-816(+)
MRLRLGHEPLSMVHPHHVYPHHTPAPYTNTNTSTSTPVSRVLPTVTMARYGAPLAVGNAPGTWSVLCVVCGVGAGCAAHDAWCMVRGARPHDLVTSPPHHLVTSPPHQALIRPSRGGLDGDYGCQLPVSSTSSVTSTFGLLRSLSTCFCASASVTPALSLAAFCALPASALATEYIVTPVIAMVEPISLRCVTDSPRKNTAAKRITTRFAELATAADTWESISSTLKPISL